VDEATATARIGSLSDWDGDPALTTTDKAMVMDRARLADRYGIYPTESGWEPTWDLYGAAALALDLRATKAANRADVDLGDVTLKRSTVADALQKRAAELRRKVVQTIRTTPSVVHPAGDARWP
jgi:hypothetical protein